MSSELLRVVGLGAGGHARVVLDILRQLGGCEIVGLLDPSTALHGTRVSGTLVIGDDSRLRGLVAEGLDGAFIGVGSVSSAACRRRLFELADGFGLRLMTAIHPSAVVAASVQRGRGLIVMAGAVVNPGASLGDNVIVNTGAVVEHDAVIGNHVHVASGATLAGGVIVEDEAHVGLGASILQGVRIGRGAVVGAGAVVIRDVAPATVVAGVPARELRKSDR